MEFVYGAVVGGVGVELVRYFWPQIYAFALAQWTKYRG